MRQLIFSLNTWSYTKNIHCCSISFLFEIIHLPISRHRRCWCLNCEHIACTFEHDIIHCLRNGGRCKKKHAYELKMSTLSIGKKEPWDSDDNGRRSTYVPFARLLTHFCACWLWQQRLDPLQKNRTGFISN